MRVVITGGAGFIGQRLARAVLDAGSLVDQTGTRREISKLVLFDQFTPEKPINDSRVEVVVGDLVDPSTLSAVIGPDVDTVFHLAGVVSGGAEADLQLGLKVNLDGTRLLLDLLAATGRRPKLIFASSLAVYGGPDSSKVSDATIPTPQSSYGVQKLCSEYLVGDYDRRGLVDGRALRFPTVAVRPGKANLANSSFISAVIREPLAGRQTICPVPDDLPIALMSPGRLIEAILKAHDLPTAEFGWPRVLVLPAFQVTVKDMLVALDELAGPEPRKLVSFALDPKIMPMVESWPAEVFSVRTDRLGIKTDASAREIVADYLAQSSR